MALYTADPVETVSFAEAATSEIPVATMATPIHGAIDVSANTEIVLVVTTANNLPIVSVDGVVVWQAGAARLGWSVNIRSVGSIHTYTLRPPSGFAYGALVTVAVDFEPGAL